MWEVKNHTPFASHGYFVRDHHGVEHWVVAMRATFDIGIGELPRIAAFQPAVKLVPEMQPEDPDEMREEADFQPFRPAADIVLHGVATLPGGEPVDTIAVTLNVGKTSKTLHCRGHQTLTKGRRGDVVSTVTPLTALPLSWRHTAGGQCQKSEALNDDNPIGSAWLADWSKVARDEEIKLPQITSPEEKTGSAVSYPAPQGFGPLQPHWGPRRHYAGTFDQAWQDTRHPRLPTDFDTRFYHSVLPDQWATLVGGEPVEVLNASADGPLRFRLPQMIVNARTTIGREQFHTRLRIIGITIDATAKTVAMIWNTAVPCNGRDTEVAGATLRIAQMSGVAA